MSSSKREQAYRNLEEALSYWQEKLAYYERELSITAGAAQRFELQKRIEECKEEIEKINPELKFLKQRNKTEQTLLDWVEHEVKSRLHSSLHNRVYILLDKEEDPSKVNPPWGIDVKIGSQPSSRLAPNITITDIYDREDINRRLLILGAPGSGKTTTLLQLAQELINRAQSDTKQPIPVLLNLSSWKDDKQSIKDWIIADLKLKYGVRKDIGKKWLEEDVIIPLLDGLDEVASARQELCAERINQFLKPGIWSSSLVVCSRTEEFQRIGKSLELNGAIILQPLTEEQIRDYFYRTGEEALWKSIKNDANLMELAQTPLFVNIMVLSYEEISFSEWKSLDSKEKRLTHLLDAYIKRMLGRPYQKKTPKPKDVSTQHWLGWLAVQLIQTNQTEFLIENLQPYWLINKREKLIYGLSVGLIVGLIYELIYGLMGGLILGSIGQQILQIYGLTLGLTLGLMEVLTLGLIGGLIGRTIETLESSPLWVKIKIGLIYGLMVGLIFGLMQGLIHELVGRQVVELIDRPIEDYIYGLIGTLSYGLIFGLIVGLIFALTINKIKTVESLSFSLKKSKKGLILGLIYGLMVGLIFGLMQGLIVGLMEGLSEARLIFGLIVGLIVGLIFGLIFGLIVGLIVGLIFGLIVGLSGPEIELKSTPNQGIKETGKNAIKLIVFPLMFWLVLFLLKPNVLGGYSLTGLALITSILTIAILVIIYSLIQHFSLRIVLWKNGYAPWNYARFLDYATDRLFLQRVGGGYRFIHRLLQGYFAQFWQPEIELFFIPDSEKPVKTQQIKKRRTKTLPRLSRLKLFVISFLTVAGFAVWQSFLIYKLFPKDAEGYYKRGLNYFYQENYHQAIENFNQAINLNPQYAEAYRARGDSYFAQEDYQNAIEDYTQVIRLKPQYADLAYYNLGIVYHKQKNFNAALSNYKQALAKDEKFWPAIANIGLIKYEIGSIDEAIQQWQEGLEVINLYSESFFPGLQLERSQFQLALAVAFYVKGEQEKAFQMAEAVLKFDKGSADLEFLKGTLWGERLLADAEKLFSTPRIQALLSSEQP